jgi:hypothetical protein
MGSSRPLAGLVSVALLVVVGLVVLLPDCASACSCASLPGSQQQITEQELSKSVAVFSGRVVQIDRPPLPLDSSIAPVTITFRVSESWKGSERETLEVKTPVSEVSCGYTFRSGESYLVYAKEASIVEEEGLEVLLCSETKPLSEASADLEALGDGERPGGSGLTDTSGAVSVGTMAGLAGLTMAASFVLMLRLVRTG